jgi:transposase
MGRGDLSDAEWAVIGLLLPPERGRWARPARR